MRIKKPGAATNEVIRELLRIGAVDEHRPEVLEVYIRDPDLRPDEGQARVKQRLDAARVDWSSYLEFGGGLQ